MKKTAVCLLIVFFTMLGHCSAQMKPHWFFHDELVEGLEHARDTVYIFDRTKLEKLGGIKTLTNGATINCKTKKGDSLFLFVREKKFERSKHKFHLEDTVYKLIHNRKIVDHVVENATIDGKRSYGVDGDVPKTEISELKIKWGSSWLKIPRSAYSNLFEPYFPSIEAYLSRDKKLLFVYLSGSDGAGSYSVKFVFDRNQYLARLVTTVECTNGYDFLDAKVDGCD